MRQIKNALAIIIFVSCGQRSNNIICEKTSVISLDTLIAGNYVLTLYNSDSFPVSDIYGDLTDRINLTDTIGDWSNSTTRIQDHLKDKLGTYFYTTDSTVVLKLSNSKTLSFANWDKENDVGYTFEYYFDKIDYFLMRVQLYEGNCWMLVNRKNGFKTFISGLPYISSDSKKILTINADLVAGYSFNGLELFSILTDSIKTEFSKETVFGPTDAKWISENEFLLRREHLQLDTVTGNEVKIIDYKKVTIEKKTS